METIDDELIEFQISGTLGDDRRPVIFTIDADDKDDAKFLFYHGIHFAFLPEGEPAEKCRLDFRTLKRSAGKS